MQRFFRSPRFLEIALPIAAVLIAFAIGGVLLAALGANPFEAYWVLLSGAFGSVNGLTATLTKMTPLLLVALGICISFRGGVINIGGEGQIIIGALASTALAQASGPTTSQVMRASPTSSPSSTPLMSTATGCAIR